VPEFTAPEEPDQVPETDHFLSYTLQFETNSAELKGDVSEVLGQLANDLKSSPYKQLVVEGHTDSVGSDSYNQKLSLKRAQKIRELLISDYQISPKMIIAKGYGSSHPIASNGNF